MLVPSTRSLSPEKRAAELGAAFLDKAKDDQGLLFFSLSRDGSERLHLQRKPYAAVFYVQGKLSYWRMLKVIEDEGGSHGDVDSGVDAALCMADPYVPWLSDDPQIHMQSGPGIACTPPVSNACLGQLGMDYGGNPSYTDSNGNEVSCGYAPIVAIYADHADWNAPGWYSGPLVVDASMDR